jgi:hypothetical protein
MADAIAVFLPGARQTFTAGGSITGGDLVVLSGASSVVKASTTGAATYVGVAGHDAATGTKVTVTVLKAVFDSIADGAVAVGDQLTTTATANRQVKSLAAAAVDVGGTPTQASINTAINTSVNNARAVIGMAITAAADNAIVRWIQD